MIINIVKPAFNIASVLKFFLYVGFLCTGLSAWAYDESSSVNFNVTGKIEDPSCEVAIKPSNSINLGTVASQHMSVAGGTGRNIPIALEFYNCSEKFDSAALTFDGQPYDSTYSMIYKNIDDSNSAATGIGLQMFSVNGINSLGPGDTSKFAFGENADSAIYYIIARMYSPYGIITPGVVKFSATFTVTYN